MFHKHIFISSGPKPGGSRGGLRVFLWELPGTVSKENQGIHGRGDRQVGNDVSKCYLSYAFMKLQQVCDE